MHARITAYEAVKVKHFNYNGRKVFHDFHSQRDFLIKLQIWTDHTLNDGIALTGRKWLCMCYKYSQCGSN